LPRLHIRPPPSYEAVASAVASELHAGQQEAGRLQRIGRPGCAHVRFLAPGFYCVRGTFPFRQQFSVNQ
jgi:hypothetical protein